MTIFISCASYRDSELPFTIQSLLENADHPQNLHIGIVDQSTKSERIDFSQYQNVSSIWIPAIEAKGAGYARAQAQTMYNNEDWFLQVDSHTRFDPSWDTKLINMYSSASSAAGNTKIILSQFPKAYEREGNKDIPIVSIKYPWEPHRQIVYWFKNSLWTGQRIPFDDPRWSIPEESETILAGFIFAPGHIVNEIPYDPDISFWGEELCFTIRAWTRGWQIYSPNEVVLSHFYNRKGHHKIWDTSNNVNKKWKVIEDNSMMRQHQIYTGELLGQWGAKDKSSLQDYCDFIKTDIGGVYTKHLHQINLIHNTHTESDIFADMITPMLSFYCDIEKHIECLIDTCQCTCHT